MKKLVCLALVIGYINTTYAMDQENGRKDPFKDGPSERYIKTKSNFAKAKEHAKWGSLEVGVGFLGTLTTTRQWNPFNLSPCYEFTLTKNTKGLDFNRLYGTEVLDRISNMSHRGTLPYEFDWKAYFAIPSLVLFANGCKDLATAIVYCGQGMYEYYKAGKETINEKEKGE